MDRTPQVRTVAYICADCQLNRPGKHPFFRARLDRDQSIELIKQLQRCAQGGERQWFYLVVTYDDPTRLRLVRTDTPAYEADAAAIYLRGEVVKVTGREGSCNIDFSGPVGALLLAERLQAARQRMRSFLEIRVPNRQHKKNLLEFIPDTELEAAESVEHQKLAVTGEALAADTLAENEFGDWEGQDG